MAVAALAVIEIAGAAWSAYQQHKAGQNAKKAGEAEQSAAEDQAQLAEYNAQVAGLQAQDTIDRGAIEEARFRTGVRGMIGAQRAAAAGNNLDVAYGSPLDIQADAAFLGELDALQIKSNAARSAWGYKVQQVDLTRSAAITRKGGQFAALQGQQAAQQANYAAIGTAFSAGSSLLQTRYGFRNSYPAGTVSAIDASYYRAASLW